MSDLFDTGDATRRRTLGDAHVNRSRRGDAVLDPPFVELITRPLGAASGRATRSRRANARC